MIDRFMYSACPMIKHIQNEIAYVIYTYVYIYIENYIYMCMVPLFDEAFCFDNFVHKSII